MGPHSLFTWSTTRLFCLEHGGGVCIGWCSPCPGMHDTEPIHRGRAILAGRSFANQFPYWRHEVHNTVYPGK